MSDNGVNTASTKSSENTASMKPAAPKRKRRREYRRHGDVARLHLLWREGVEAIDGRTRAGKVAKTWRRRALEKKGGRSCPLETKEVIEAGAFYLWRAICLRSYIIQDALKRGTPLNRRHGKLPAMNEQCDSMMRQWKQINDELGLKELDLARQLQREAMLRQSGGK